MRQIEGQHKLCQVILCNKENPFACKDSYHLEIKRDSRIFKNLDYIFKLPFKYI